ncbi:unnamed protein product [Closterium sp. NIES-65]|nr:unnamed protein product [Closterium sp. NIES-65]
MAARRTAQQERGDGYVATIEVDGHPMPKLVLGDELSLFDGAATILLAAYEKQGPYDVDVYAIKVPGVIEAEVRVRRVHPLLQEPDDAEAHINLAILDVAYSPTVHGLLGQFYRANATSEPTLNYSILSHLMAMPLVPSESSSEGELEGVPEDYVTSSLLAPDCEFTQFSLFSKKTTSNGDADLSNSGSNNAGTDSSSSSRMTETTSSEIIIRASRCSVSVPCKVPLDMWDFCVVELVALNKTYNRLCGKITKLATLLKKLDPSDAFRIEMTDQLLNKLYNMGVIPTTKSLNLCDKLSVSSFCRRRLAVVMVRLKMAEHMREAVSFVQQGHVRIGPEAVRDPAFLVTRAMEDMLTWVDTSKIKHKLRRSDRLLAVRSAACIFLRIPLPSGISPAAPAVPPHSLHALHWVVRELCHVEGSGQARLIQSRPVQWGVDRCRPIPTPPSSAFAPFRRLIPDPRAPAGSKRSFSAATSPPIPPNSAPSVGGSIGRSTGGAGGRKGGRGLVGVITAAAIAGAAGGAYYCVHVAEQDSLAAAVREREREGEVERERIEQQREEMGRELEEWKEGEARRQQEEEEEMAISTLQAVLLQQLAAATAAETEAKEAAEAHGEQTELLKVEISALKDVFFHRSQEDRLSWHAHRVALISALRGVFFEPAQEERLSWHVHRVALDPLVSSLLPRGDDPLVAAIAATLPKSALANGVLTRQQLQERLEGMRARVCQLAMLPPANGGEREDVGGESGGGKGGRGGGELVEPGLLSQAVAAVAVALKFPVPTTPGEAPSPEQALSEATTLLVEGRLEEAAGAMERGVKGTRAEGVVRQWGEEVRGRAAVEQAVRVMQAHAGCMAAELRSSGKFESRRGGEGRAAVEQAVRVMQAHAGCMAAELRSAVVSGAVGGSGDAVGGGGEGKGSSGTGSEGDAGACRVHGSRAS